MKSTIPGGDIKEIENCYIDIPGFGQKKMYVLPEISDGKGAAYTSEAIIGRSQPLRTFSHSEDRAISMTVHLFVRKQTDIMDNINFLRALQSCVYPRDGSGGAPFAPPAVCSIKCGLLLADNEICVILKNYSVDFPTDVAWDQETLVPYKFDIKLSWELAYSSDDLPGQDRILRIGY